MSAVTILLALAPSLVSLVSIIEGEVKEAKSTDPLSTKARDALQAISAILELVAKAV